MACQAHRRLLLPASALLLRCGVNFLDVDLGAEAHGVLLAGDVVRQAELEEFELLAGQALQLRLKPTDTVTLADEEAIEPGGRLIAGGALRIPEVEVVQLLVLRGEGQ